MFDFLFNPQGRISRKGFWLGFLLPYLAITVGLSVIGGLVPVLAILSTLAGLFYFWPSAVAVPVKRFHDLGMTGFWQLGFVLAEIVLIVVFFAGIGIYAVEAGMESELEAMATMSEAEQMAVLGGMIGEALGSPLVLGGLGLLILLNLVWLYFMGIRRGQAGPNQHGEDPHASGRGFAD